MTDMSCEFDFEIPATMGHDRYLDNVLIYISGYIMRRLIETEKCTFCYTFLTECKERVSCELINFKQLGGLMYPLFDIVSVVQIANSAVELALENKSLGELLKCGVHITNEIVSEILCSQCDLLQEICLHDADHRTKQLKKIVFTFVSLKAKHLCRTKNIETSTMIRHNNTKQVIFMHE